MVCYTSGIYLNELPSSDNDNRILHTNERTCIYPFGKKVTHNVNVVTYINVAVSWPGVRLPPTGAVGWARTVVGRSLPSSIPASERWPSRLCF